MFQNILVNRNLWCCCTPDSKLGGMSVLCYKWCQLAPGHKRDYDQMFKLLIFNQKKTFLFVG